MSWQNPDQEVVPASDLQLEWQQRFLENVCLDTFTFPDAGFIYGNKDDPSGSIQIDHVVKKGFSLSAFEAYMTHVVNCIKNSSLKLQKKTERLHNIENFKKRVNSYYVNTLLPQLDRKEEKYTSCVCS